MIAHFDCFAGISGDMTLGAFVDAGVPADWLEQTLKENLLTDFDLAVSESSKMGIAAESGCPCQRPRGKGLCCHPGVD
ncbi:MAG: nickel insertion protein [Desulfobacterales bacterium]